MVSTALPDTGPDADPAATAAPDPAIDPATEPGTGPVRFGVVGVGFIAQWFAEAVAQEPAARIVAVASAHPERARDFAQRHGVPHAHAGFDEMLHAHGPAGDDPIDVVYIASPNALHAQQAIASLEAGFHVLVEKPFALSPTEAKAMVDSARAAGRFLMEAWLPAFEPGVARLREVLPRLGRVHRAVLVKEQFSSRMEAYRAGELPAVLDPAQGGGSLMDLGIYPVNLAIHLFGTPDRVTATGQLLDSGADSHGTVVLSYEHGPHRGLEVVCLHSKTSVGAIDSVIAAEQAAVVIDDCQWPRRIELRGPREQEPRALLEDLSVRRRGPQLAYELAEVCRLVGSGAHQAGLHPLYASLAAVDVLSQARAQVGIRFPEDLQA
ncbi:Gfo/Idh/MocA family protein [Actinomyces capricornis]|uniref:Oxidoreductase YulF n=1 Tax=Actinomyces capricornis TaxID=2755559 RepID=A0ABM7UCX7_9ACTO|nr:Gfo/Idh/MocA family oxidoreductase [Actinomyces capricornis]BDA65037.1 putative oxidoreductase YulF [Actinomyces capricornis]